MKHAQEQARTRPTGTGVASQDALRRVFVVGFPRSGTTWVTWLLAKLDGVSVLQQSGLFHALEDIDRWWKARHSFSNGEDLEGAERRGTDEILDRESYRRLLRPLCDHVFQRIAQETPGTQVVVEQTPENLQFHDEVLELFPDAYFLHVVRDPRDAAVSMKRAARAWENEFPGRPIHIANRWVEYAERAKKLASKTDRVLSVRYEDLLQNGPEELARIAAWMDVETSPDACKAAIEACSFGRVRGQQNAEIPKGFFGRGESGGWRGELSRSDLRILEYVLGDAMEEAGYAREHPRSRVKPLAVSLHEILALRAQRPQRALSKFTRPLRLWFAFRRRERDYTRAQFRD